MTGVLANSVAKLSRQAIFQLEMASLISRVCLSSPSTEYSIQLSCTHCVVHSIPIFSSLAKSRLAHYRRQKQLFFTCAFGKVRKVGYVQMKTLHAFAHLFPSSTFSPGCHLLSCANWPVRVRTRARIQITSAAEHKLTALLICTTDRRTALMRAAKLACMQPKEPQCEVRPRRAN